MQFIMLPLLDLVNSSGKKLELALLKLLFF